MGSIVLILNNPPNYLIHDKKIPKNDSLHNILFLMRNIETFLYAYKIIIKIFMVHKNFLSIKITS
jgi:hypothetical protein